MPETIQLTPPVLKNAIFASRGRFEPDQDVDPTRYVKLWREEELILGRPGKSMVLILRTRGCTWDYKQSCTMCGYFVDTVPKRFTSEQLIHQWERAAAQYQGEDGLKIYTGGNFPDPTEVFPAVQDAILEGAGRLGFKKVTVETRPEYVTHERMQHFADLLARSGARLEIAVGLESSNQVVCDQAIGKGYALKEFIHAATIARDHGVGVKCYLLLKPPFLTEDETVEDIVQSIRDAAPFSDIISINPTNVQKHTLVDQMYRHNEYRSPWLWSILEVLQRGKPLFPQGILKSDPVGGGMARGAHNCGRCDERILHLIDRYNVTQDLAFVEAALQVDCSCRPKYRVVRDLEGYLVGSHYTD